MKLFFDHRLRSTIINNKGTNDILVFVSCGYTDADLKYIDLVMNNFLRFGVNLG